MKELWRRAERAAGLERVPRRGWHSLRRKFGTVSAYPNGSNPEGVSVDAAGNVYGAVVSGGGAFVRSSR